jgi:hypothetical protein
MFDPNGYGPEIGPILEAHEGGARLMPLAPPGPLQGEGLTRLRGLSSGGLFGRTPVVAQDFADCVRSALFLYFSDLDASHTISQGIPTTTGSYWHAIMHRQEPDFSNSKYWFRRVGGHEVFPRLRAVTLEALQTRTGESVADRLREQIQGRAQWDPFWFVDQCEAASHGGGADLEQWLRKVQRLEWQLLFDYCYRKAVGIEGESVHG